MWQQSSPSDVHSQYIDDVNESPRSDLSRDSLLLSARFDSHDTSINGDTAFMSLSTSESKFPSLIGNSDPNYEDSSSTVITDPYSPKMLRRRNLNTNYLDDIEKVSDNDSESD